MPIRMLLTDFIRDRAGLTGTHVGCTYEGVCGACTVHVDGEAVKSCLMLAVQADGHAVTTVEGLATNGQLSPLQKSFNEHHALQCGYCTPGILMNMAEFIEKHPNPTDEEIRHALIGNLCRCTGYVHIVDAVRAAAKSAATHLKAARLPASDASRHSRERRDGPLDGRQPCGRLVRRQVQSQGRSAAAHRSRALHRRHRGAGHAAPRVRAQPGGPRPDQEHRHEPGEGHARASWR